MGEILFKLFPISHKILKPALLDTYDSGQRLQLLVLGQYLQNLDKSCVAFREFQAAVQMDVSARHFLYTSAVLSHISQQKPLWRYLKH